MLSVHACLLVESPGVGSKCLVELGVVVGCHRSTLVDMMTDIVASVESGARLARRNHCISEILRVHWLGEFAISFRVLFLYRGRFTLDSSFSHQIGDVL